MPQKGYYRNHKMEGDDKKCTETKKKGRHKPNIFADYKGD